MTAKPSVPPLQTQVGHASWGDNQVRGFSLLHDLVTHSGFWCTASLALGGPRISAEDEALLDHVSTCTYACDPRIWPLKAVRLGSAHGSYTAGLCVGLLATEDSRIGPSVSGRAAQLIADAAESLDDGPIPEPAVMMRWLERRLVSEPQLPGFGVAFRARDERVDAVARCLEVHGRAGHRHWQLMLVLDACMRERRAPVNLASALAAVCLDLGFRPQQIGPLATLMTTSSYVANACEGAQQRPPVLQQLPDATIDYRGPPPRESPRARAASEAATTTTPTKPPTGRR